MPKLLEQGVTFVDGRTHVEYAMEHVEGAVNIPLDEVRERLRALDKDSPQYIYCEGGQRSYMALCILEENGFHAQHLAGGYGLYGSAAMGQVTAFRYAKCEGA